MRRQAGKHEGEALERSLYSFALLESLFTCILIWCLLNEFVQVTRRDSTSVLSHRRFPIPALLTAASYDILATHNLHG